MLTAPEAAKRAVHHVTEMTRREAEGVVGAERAGGGWRVTVEVVEVHRIPDSANIIAVYETEVDEGGELVAYRRVARYLRGQLKRGGGGR
jgi:Gas vesicle synthesis protein GvpO